MPDPLTRKTWRNPLHRFESILKKLKIVDPLLVTEKHLFEFIRAMQMNPRPGGSEPYSNATIGVQRTCLRAFYRWAHRERLIDRNPAQELSSIRLATNFHPNPLSVEDRDRLLRGILHPRTFQEARCYLATAFGRYQGFRIHEACKVRFSDFDLKADTLRVVGKGKKTADILPLHPVTKHCLGWMKKFQYDTFGDPRLKPVEYALAQEGFPNRPASTSSKLLHKSFKRTLVKCKIEGKHRFHDLRATYATELVEKGADEFVLKEFARMTIETAAYYVKASREKKDLVWKNFSAGSLGLLKTATK